MATENRTALFYLSSSGKELGRGLAGLFPSADLVRFQAKNLAEYWESHTNLVFIMAAGIVVRAIAPLLGDKKSDPGVVVLDEKGRHVVSLLSGHLGGANALAEKISAFLGGQAVITTASDVNGLPSLDLWAKAHNLEIEDWQLVPGMAARFITSGVLRIFTDTDISLPDGFLPVSTPEQAEVLVTNKLNPFSPGEKNGEEAAPPDSFSQPSRARLFMRVKNLVVGIGCNSGTSVEEIQGLVSNTLEAHNLAARSLCLVVTLDKKGKEPGLVAFAASHGLDIRTFTPAELNSVQGVVKSEVVYKTTGAQAVAEPAALLGAGTSSLLVNKRKSGNVTVAVAELPPGRGSFRAKTGKLSVVGIGPGAVRYLTVAALDAIREAEVIVGYGSYLDQVRELIKHKLIIKTGMRQEQERCLKAIDLAREGRRVALVSGGDPGVYAMAGLVFELLKSGREKEEAGGNSLPAEMAVEVVPGVSALNACAARLGAPLMHDFASISLSDRLTAWEVIEKRLGAAAAADFVIALYNPKSKGRPWQIEAAREIILKHRTARTAVGIVRGAMREEEQIIITNLKQMLEYEIDMSTLLIIGNSASFTWNNWMITPRGYENSYDI